MRITTAIVTSLGAHLAVMALNFQEFPDQPNGHISSQWTAEFKQKIIARLKPPLVPESQYSADGTIGANLDNPVPETMPPHPMPPTSYQAPPSNDSRQISGVAPVRYYERNEVDRPPRIIDNLDAKDGPLEKALAEFEIDGSIILECWISERGVVDKLNVSSTTLPDTVVRIIVAQAKQAGFVPARLNHVAVPSVILIELSIQEKSKAPSF